MALFCNSVRRFISLLFIFPQDAIAYDKCGRIRLLYIVVRIGIGTKFFRRERILFAFRIWLDFAVMCVFQERWLSIKTPRNLISLTFSIWLLSICSTFCELSNFFLGLWKKMHFVFSIFRESLFVWNHFVINFNSSFALLIRESMSLLWNIRLVSSANKIILQLLGWGMSFM